MLGYILRRFNRAHPVAKVMTAVGAFFTLLIIATSCVSEVPLGPIPTEVPEQAVSLRYIGEKGLVEFWEIRSDQILCIAAIRPDSVDLECR